MSSADEPTPDAGTILVAPTETKKARFYIPTEKADAEQTVEAVATRLSFLFGGATVLRGSGHYVMDDGSLCRESVAVVESFEADDAGLLQDIATDIKRELSEEAVAFEVLDTSIISI